jgi:hypothetical protein
LDGEKGDMLVYKNIDTYNPLKYERANNIKEFSINLAESTVSIKNTNH